MLSMCMWIFVCLQGFYCFVIFLKINHIEYAATQLLQKMFKLTGAIKVITNSK